MKEIIADRSMIAKCGLYCGSCGKYLKGKCQGCEKNEKASWCKIRLCCLENGYSSCAECTEYTNVMECSKYNNFIAKVIGFVFNSDRSKCIQMIKEKGYDNFALYMTENKIVSLKR